MVNLPSQCKKRERSSTYSGHSKLLYYYQKMLRSISNRSTNSAANELNASNNNSASCRRRTLSIFRTPELIKKIFNSSSNIRDENEMYEIIRRSSSEQNVNTVYRSESNISADDILHRPNDQSIVRSTTCPTATTGRRVSRTISRFTNKLKLTRHEQNDQEKNNEFIVVDGDLNSASVFLRVDDIGQQTQHAAEPSVGVHVEHFDLNQIQYASAISHIPNSPPQQPELGLARILVDNHARHVLEAHSTRSSVECAVPESDHLNVHDTHATSPSSTNSSSHEYTGMDRSILDDTEYVRAQQLDLERITILGIELFQEYNYLKSDLQDELDFNALYEKALDDNEILKKELQILQEKYDQIYSPWSCGVCTFDNLPYNETKRDICEMCDAPSPLKLATLTQ